MKKKDVALDFLTIYFIFLPVLPSSEHYPGLYKRNTAFFCFLRAVQ